MTLNEVLALEKIQTSVKQIDMYISKQKPNSYEHIKALSYKCLVLHSLNKTREALKILLEKAVNFNNYDNKAIVAICDSLIDIFIDISNYEQTLKYINIKKEHLPEIDKDKYYYDLIRYYDMTGDKLELKRNIVIYLENDISDDKRIYALELLVKYQYDDMEYEGFYTNQKKLESYYLKNFMYEPLLRLRIMKANALMNEGLLDEAYSFLKSFEKDDYVDINTLINIVTLELEILLNKKEYRKAQILEADYNEKYLNATTKISLEFAIIAKKVSEAVMDRVSVEEYNERITELENKLKLILKEETKAKKEKPKKSKININIIEKEALENDVVIEKNKYVETVLKEEPTLIEVSSNYKSIENIINVLGSKNDVLFREVFRQYGIEIERKFSPCEIVIALLENGEGFHYKKERVYEKTFQDSDIEDTIIYELINNTKKMFILDIKESLFDKNIITKKEYEDNFKTVIGFQIEYNDRVLGAIVYEFFTQEFKDKLIYEALKMLSSMLSLSIVKYVLKKEEDLEIKRNEFIFNNSNNGLKSEHDHIISLNSQAKEILGIKYDELEDSEYKALIDYKDVLRYKEVFDAIYNMEIDKIDIKYHINDKYIKESITVSRDDITRIYSIIEDITYSEKEEKRLKDMAFNDPLSHLLTKRKLYEDIKLVLKDKKFALSLISTANFKMYFDIYGYSFADELVYAIGKILLEIKDDYKNISIYHLENDKFMILFKDSNDQRGIYNKTKAILEKLKFKLYNLNQRLNMDFKAGIFRYTKSMRVTDVKRIIWFTSEALQDAYENYEDTNACMMYNEQTSNKRFKESQIVLHVSEAIDNNELKIKYHQIVNMKDNLVEYYKASLNLINFTIDDKYFYEVIQKRDIKELTDKYLIGHTLNELKTFYSKNNTYYKTIIPVFKSVFMSNTFISFLEKNLEFFKIPYPVICLYIIEDNDFDCINNIRYFRSKGLNIASSNFDFVIRNNCSIYFLDIKKYNEDIIDVFKEACDKLSIEVFGMNVSSKEDILITKNHNIDVCEGEVFKKLLSLNDLIDMYEK